MDAPATTPTRGFAWAILSFIGFVTSLFAIFPVLIVIRWFTDTTHLTEMALWSIVWGGLSLVGVLLAARVTFGRWLPVPPFALAFAAVGVGLSGVVNVVLQQWEITRYGITEPQLVGWTAGLFAVLLGLSVAAFGALIAPSGARGWPVAATLAGAVAVLAMVLLNVPGLADGIEPESWPLAIWVGLSAAYATIAGLAAVNRLRG